MKGTSMLMARGRTSTTMTVLGELAVFGEDRAIDLGAPRQRSVLAALALHANRSLSTQRIVATVWNTGEPTYASNLVHKYVSGLRRALAELEPHRRISIDNDRGGYRLTVRADQLDFTLFHAQVEAAEDLRDQESTPEPPTCTPGPCACGADRSSATCPAWPSTTNAPTSKACA